MASPMQVPPLRRRRSLAGPIILIILGGLFLLGNLRIVGWGSLGYWFGHYWPVLLILGGIVKLFEYQEAQREGTRAPGVGVGGVLLILLLIGMGSAAHHASGVNWGELRDHIDIDGADIPFLGETYSYDDRIDQTFPSDGTLRVSSERGAINITTSETDQIRVMVQKRIRASNQSEADRWNARTKPQLSGDRAMTLDANTRGAGDHWISTDLDIALPRKASVVISTRRGDIRVTGRDGNLDLSSSHGQVAVDDVKGNVSANLQHSSGRISQVAGGVSVEGRPDDVELSDVKGPVRMNGEFDSLKLSKIANSVTFKSARTDLEISRVDGDLSLDSDALAANNIVGPVRLTTRSKDVRLQGVSGDLRLQNENGEVEIRIAKLGNVQIDNRSSDVQIYLPEKASFQLEARARNGDVQSDFNEVKVNNNDDQGSANGRVGEGGPKIVVNNEHAGIEIRKGSLVAEAPVPPKLPKAPKAPKLPAEPQDVPEPTDN
jgi:DUF4097 and DUF4098 domain-containing protein YvlB